MNTKVHSLFQSSPELDAMRDKLLPYLKGLGDGVKVGWAQDIGRALGVSPDVRVKRLARHLFHNVLGRWWIPIPGYGFETSSPETSRDIVVSKGRRIKAAIELTQTAGEQLIVRHPDMSSSDRKSIDHTIATLSTLSLVKSLAAKKD